MQPEETLLAEEASGAPGVGMLTLARETIVYGAAAFVQRFGGFILVPVYGRVFTQEQYGVVSLLVVTTGLLFALSSLQLDSAAQRWFFDRDDEDHRARTVASWVWVQLVLATGVAVVMGLLAPQIADWLFGSAADAAVVVAAAATIPVGVLGYAAGNVMRMRRRPWPMVLLAVMTMAVTVGATLMFVLVLEIGPAGVFLGQGVAGLVTSVVGIALLGAGADPRRLDGSRLREMLRFAVPLLPLPIAAWILSASDRYFIETFVSVGAVGVYQMGAMVGAIVALATISFSFAWYPWALSMFRRQDAVLRYARAFDLFVFGGTVLALAVSLLAEPLLRLIASEEFLGGAAMVPWLAPAHVAAAAVTVGATGALVAKDARPFGISMYVGAAATLVGNLLLVPRIGILGGAITTLVAQSIVAIIVFWRSRQRLQVPFRWFRCAGFFALGVCAGLWSTTFTGIWPGALLFVTVTAIGAVAVVRP